jgi:hypothetical protein
METQIAAGINEHSFQNILKSVNDEMQVCIQNWTVAASMPHLVI